MKEKLKLKTNVSPSFVVKIESKICDAASKLNNKYQASSSSSSSLQSLSSSSHFTDSLHSQVTLSNDIPAIILMDRPRSRKFTSPAQFTFVTPWTIKEEKKTDWLTDRFYSVAPPFPTLCHSPSNASLENRLRLLIDDVKNKKSCSWSSIDFIFIKHW